MRTIKNLVLDIDGVLGTNPHTIPIIFDVWRPTLARDLGLSEDEVAHKNEGHLHKYSCSATGFYHEYRDALGLPPTWVEDIYAETAELSGKHFAAQHRPCQRRLRLMKQLKEQGITFYTLSHGHPAHANVVLKAAGVEEFIPLENRFDRVNLFNHEKNQAASKLTPYPYQRLLKATGINPHESAMAEDSRRNLEAAFNIGMRTVLVGDQIIGNTDPYINQRFETLEDYLETLVLQPALALGA